MTSAPGRSSVRLDAATHARVGFATALARHGARPALVTDEGALSYADLAVLVDLRREALEQPAGARRLVALRPAPTVDFVADYLAALAGGHVVLLSRDDVLPRAYGATADRPPELHPDLRLLLSTSGSTGSPKLVRLSAENVQSNAEAIASYLGLTADDRALTTLPLDYCYGLSVLHSHLWVGASVVLSDRSVTDPELWDVARRTEVTSFAGVPYTFELLDAAGWPRLPSLRCVTQAGGRMAPDRVRAVAERAAREGFDLFVMYGQTEATARIAYLPPHLAAEHPTAIGLPVPGGDLRLEPVEGAEEGVGELVYTGPNVMMGYAHSVADLARGADLTELRTGDLARRDDAGLFEIVGRRSRFAKIFGQRIDLDRVETLLALDHVAVACAEAPGERLVVAVPGTTSLALVADRVTAATGLPSHAVTAVRVDEVPRTANGKVDLAAVAGLAGTARATRSDPVPPVAALSAVYADVLGIEHVRPGDSFVGLGGDSLSYVELSLQLEARLRRVPPDWPTRTVAELAGLAADGRRRRWARVETGVLLRAVAIVLIVGTHTNLFTVLGGAHVLLAVVGANFARFQLADGDPAARRRRVLHAAARVAVPSALWTLLVAVTLGGYGWRNVLLVNQTLGGSTWAEPQWQFWFIEVVLWLVLGFGLLLSLPRVLAVDREHPFGLPCALLVASLVPRFLAGYVDRDVIHTWWFVAWLFVAGWAGVRATSVRQRLLVSALVLLAVPGFFDGQPWRGIVVATGVLALLWVRSVPWPRPGVRPLGVLASSTLAIYLTHWVVYPHLEMRWPLGGLLASLALGITVWWVSGQISAAIRRMWHRRSQYAPFALPKEAR